MRDSGLEPSIFRFIFRYSKRDQIYLTVLTALSFPILYFTLELPKIIINQAIGGTEFPQTVLGYSFDQIEFLLLLCFAFLGLVLINGGMKYYVSVYRGRLGERMLRRLRFELYTRVLRFPLPQFKRMSSGEIIPMITSEVEPLGGFIGDALALPMLQGGTLATYMTFIFIQDFWLGLAAVALYPFQMYLIPKLQRQVNQLAKRRVRTVRMLADRIGETVAGIGEVHANNGTRLLRADVTSRLNTIYEIRYEIFRRKFFIKFLNNFLGQLTPFFFYSIGGYFVIKGELSFGALVAVIAAYKDLASPWKELLDFYQVKEDARIKYEQVIEQFEPEGIMDEGLFEADDPGHPLRGEINVANVRYSDDGRTFVIDGATFAADTKQHLAIVGPSGAGKEEMGMLLARLLMPSAGQIRIGERRLSDLPEATTGRRIGYAGPTVHLFTSSVYDNLTLGLKHKPLGEKERDDDAKAARQTYVSEAELTGNLADDIEGDWIDYQAAGVTGAEDLAQRIDEVLHLVELDGDIYQFGLRGTIDPVAEPELADKVLRARAALRDRLAEPPIRQLVEPFDENAYNTNATLAENLLFGTPVDATFATANLPDNDYVLSVLDEEGLTDELLRIGYQIAETMVEIFADLPPGHEFFAQYSFIDSDALPEVQAIVNRAGIEQLDALRSDERRVLLALPFYLIEKRHRLDLIDETMKGRIVKARHALREKLPKDLRGAIEFFDSEAYNAAATLQDNILFGKIAYGQAQAEATIGALIAEVVDGLGLRDAVIFVGLGFNVGIGGGRLTSAQRQKLAIARALLKRPDILILNEAVTVLDNAAQSRVLEAVRRDRAEGGVIAVLHRADLAVGFDHVIVMSGGHVVEHGSREELDREGTMFHMLLSSG